MRLVIALDLNDDDLTEAYGIDPRTETFGDEWDDLFRSIEARAKEFFCGKGDRPVVGQLVTMGDFTDVLPELLDAAEVGADGITDEYKRGHVQGSLVSMREFLA